MCGVIHNLIPDGSMESRSDHCSSRLLHLESGEVKLKRLYRDSMVGSEAHFFCNYGYKLIGVDRRTCASSGEWTDSNPLCVRG